MQIQWVGSDRAQKKAGTAAADDLAGQGGGDTLSGLDGADRLYGGLGRDRLYGGAGDDLLRGEKGADRLFGGAGADYLELSGGDVATGGGGADTFLIYDPGKGGGPFSDLGTVTIRDFDALGGDHDTINLGIFAQFADVTWQDRDRGLDDGFEVLRRGEDTALRLKGQTGTIVTVVMDDVRPAQLTLDRFDFD